MSCKSITVTAPSRLHFGLLSFGQPERRQFGGVGVMVSQPTLRLRVHSGSGLVVDGVQAARATHFAKEWSQSVLNEPAPECAIVVESVAPAHIGLGSGTQLALGIATALNELYGLPRPSAVELAASVCRGGRSAIGTYGFLMGGLISEAGRRSNESLGALHERVTLPGEWRFVLLKPTTREGVSGEDEKRAFLELPPVPDEVTERLWLILEEGILAAARDGQCEEFGQNLYEYGCLAGSCFARLQGGPFASVRVAEVAAGLREAGFSGVGQSSWGPTLFVVVDSEQTAGDVVKWAKAREIPAEVAQPDNQGVRCEIH